MFLQIFIVFCRATVLGLVVLSACVRNISFDHTALSNNAVVLLPNIFAMRFRLRTITRAICVLGQACTLRNLHFLFGSFSCASLYHATGARYRHISVDFVFHHSGHVSSVQTVAAASAIVTPLLLLLR